MDTKVSVVVEEFGDPFADEMGSAVAPREEAPALIWLDRTCPCGNALGQLGQAPLQEHFCGTCLDAEWDEYCREHEDDGCLAAEMAAPQWMVW